MNDLRFAFRRLWNNPGFATIAILTLGLGIGAASGVFGLIAGVLLSPPPYSQPGRLTLISPARTDGQPYKGGSTVGQWMEFSKTEAFQSVALYRWTFNFLILPEGSESIEGMVVTRNYFQTLGLKPILGRLFEESEAAGPRSRPTAVMLGYDLWQRRFNGDTNILGKTVRISRSPEPLPVIGVMPPGVRFLPDPLNANEPSYDLNAQVDFWASAIPDETRPKDGGWNAVGRLRDNVSLVEAQAAVRTIATRQAQADRDLEGITANVQRLQQALNHEGNRLLMPLFGAVAMVFLTACCNVSGLLLARGLRRQQEYAVCAALGAGRRRLFRQVLAESVMVALLGGAAGAALATGTIRMFKAIGGHAVPRLDGVTVGWSVFAFGFGAAMIAAVIAGLLPAVRASRLTPFLALKGAQSSAGRGERRLLGGVATLQTALTMALLVGAALLIRTTTNLARVRPGYDTQNVLTMTVTSVQRDRWKEFHTQALERVSALPGVKHAAFVWGLPLTGNKWGGDMEIVGRPTSSQLKDQISLPLRSVTADYFDALGIQVVDGRGFRASDNGDAPPVAVVNEALAARYFPGANPIGSKMRYTGDTNRTIEIVGIVSNTRTEALSEQAQPEIYFPFWQQGAFSKHLILRTASDPRPLVAMVQRELRAVEPTAAVEHIRTMEEIRRESVAPRIFAMRLLTGFAVVTSALALVGIYGVISLSVGSRTKEIAVRTAIGAQRRQILGLILSEGFRLVALGLLVGLGLAISLGRILRAFLFEVQPADLATLAVVATLFAAVAMVACWLPARRATRVDPMEALRYE